MHWHETADAYWWRGLRAWRILGAAFILSWAAEVAQMDISQSLALAFLALISILPGNTPWICSSPGRRARTRSIRCHREHDGRQPLAHRPGGVGCGSSTGRAAASARSRWNRGSPRR